MSYCKGQHPSPAEEDPFVHQWLSSLSHFSPQSGFDERVLSRVWRPDPLWMQTLRRLARRTLQRRLAWRWGAALAASSCLWLFGIAVVASTHWVQVETMMSVLVGGYALEGWRFAMNALGAFTAHIMTWVELVRANREPAILAAAVTALLLAASAWGLKHTISRYELHRGRLDVGR